MLGSHRWGHLPLLAPVPTADKPVASMTGPAAGGFHQAWAGGETSPVCLQCLAKDCQLSNLIIGLLSDSPSFWGDHIEKER
jgi:hypothetical protein